MQMVHRLGALAICAAALAGESYVPGLTPETYEAWRDHVRPTEAELAYRKIPWRSSLREGVLAARREGRPILLWAMDGHPLGGT